MADGEIVTERTESVDPEMPLWWVTRSETDDDNGRKVLAPDGIAACDIANAESSIVDPSIEFSRYRFATPYYKKFPHERPIVDVPVTRTFRVMGQCNDETARLIEATSEAEAIDIANETSDGFDAYDRAITYVPANNQAPARSDPRERELYAKVNAAGTPA